MPFDAIPTDYRGFRFRSRLEATWACWFDKARWPWRYEPIDLAGYIPDFILTFSAGQILVEVKPALTLTDLRPYTSRLAHVGWAGEALLVGAGLFRDPPADVTVELALGLLNDGDEWAAAPVGRCWDCPAVAFCHAHQSFTSRSCGHHPGGHGLNQAPDVVAELERWWAEAQNITQWRP